VKFPESGYVRITITYSVDVTDPKYLNVSIQMVDSGIGVPEDAVNTLFTPFTPSANSAAKNLVTHKRPINARITVNKAWLIITAQ
jgi:osomolarity two-component system sensor histidine kinase TcsA